MSNKRIFLFALTLCAAIAVTIPLIVSAANRSAKYNPPNPQFSSTNEVQAASTDETRQVLSFQVTRNGFEPSEITVTQGKFLILLQNRSGRRDLNFRLTRENEGRVAESDPKRRDWKAHVRLNPGTYILDETNDPTWRSVIRVTN